MENKKSKRKFIEGKEYLCGIGPEGGIPYKYEVGTYRYSSFSFSNGEHNNIELPYKYSSRSNINVILTAKLI